jgi:regulator of PEP synthase PpsR (kinase-PPPase family)
MYCDVYCILAAVLFFHNATNALVNSKHDHNTRCAVSHSTVVASTPVSLPEYDDRNVSEEEEELIRLIRGPMGMQQLQQQQHSRPRPKAIIILSDTTGVTAKSAVEKSLAQFNGCDERYIVRYMSEDNNDNNNDDDDSDADNDDNDEKECENLTTQIHPFVKTDQEIASIIQRVSERRNAVVVYTLSDPILRDHTSRLCTIEDIPHVDLLGPMYDVMSVFFNRQPFGTDAYKRSFDPIVTSTTTTTTSTNENPKPIQRRYLSEDYYRQIEAIEFTLKCDDGMNVNQLPEADVVICGVSRTGKTPLSVVMAQTMGLKVVDLPPPTILLNPLKVNPKRVFVLTLNADDLMKIRKTRIERELIFSSKQSTYADRTYIRNDLKHAKQLSAQYGFTEIDVTGRAVEETASLIRSYLYDRFGDL